MTQTPAVVQYKDGAATTATSITVTLDSTPTNNNYLIAILKELSTTAITLPSGWTACTSTPYNGTTVREILVAYKKVAGDAAAVTFSTSAAATKYCSVYEVSGLDLVAPFSSTITTTVSSSVTSKQCTTTGTLPQANCFVLSCTDTSADNGGEISVDSGFTLRGSATFISLMPAEKITSATTALAPTFVWTTARQAIGLQTVFLAGPDVPAAPVISTPTAAQIVTSTSFNVTGTAESGSTVTLYNNADNSVMGTATATGGSWTIALSGQAEASYTVYAKAANSGGTGTASSTRSYTVLLVPAAPVISSPTAAQVLTTASFNVTGTALSGSTVTLYRVSDNAVLGTATATGGNYSIALSSQTTGSYSVYAKAANAAGSGTASANRSYSVLLVPAAPVISTPTAAQVLTSAAFNVTGTAEASSTVTLYNASNVVMGTATATGGSYSIALSGQVTGTYVVHATATNATGEGASSSTRTYSVLLTSPGSIGSTLTYSMNRCAGTLVGGVPTLDATGAANIFAGTTGLALVGALNVAAGNTLPNYKDLAGVLNQLAGTTGYGVDAAASQIPA